MNKTIVQEKVMPVRDQRLAAVVGQPGNKPDDCIDRVISILQRSGIRVAGLRQRVIAGSGSGCGVRLEDILTGELHRITQNLGSGSTSCNIDSAAVEQLALNQSRALGDGVDLLFVNRFGKRESQGAGFCCVFERAVELNIPVLTVVKESGLQTWLDYGGECVAALPSNEQLVRRWCDDVIGITA